MRRRKVMQQEFHGVIVDPPFSGNTITITFPDLDKTIHGGTWNASYRGEPKEEIMRLRILRRLRASKIRNQTRVG